MRTHPPVSRRKIPWPWHCPTSALLGSAVSNTQEFTVPFREIVCVQRVKNGSTAEPAAQLLVPAAAASLPPQAAAAASTWVARPPQLIPPSPAPPIACLALGRRWGQRAISATQASFQDHSSPRLVPAFNTPPAAFFKLAELPSKVAARLSGRGGRPSFVFLALDLLLPLL